MDLFNIDKIEYFNNNINLLIINYLFIIIEMSGYQQQEYIISIQPVVEYQIEKIEKAKTEFEYCPYTDSLINNCCVSQFNENSYEYDNINIISNPNNKWLDDLSCLCCFVPCILGETLSLPFKFCYHKLF